MSSFIYSGAPILPSKFAGLGNGGAPAPTGTIVAWWEFDAATSFSDTAGTTPATNGSALAYVKDQRGGANPVLAALVGSSGSTVTPSPIVWHSSDADNSKGYAQGNATAADKFLICQQSVTYDAVLMVVKAASTQWDAAFDAIFDDSGDVTAKTFCIGNKLNSTLIDLNSLDLTIQSPGIFYAEDGSSGAVDSLYSQAGGLDEYHVIAWQLPSPRTGYPLVFNGFDVHLNFSGRMQACILMSGSTDAQIKANMQYLHGKFCAGYAKKTVWFDSDSIFCDVGNLSAIANEIPQRTMAILAGAVTNPITAWRGANMAIGGQTLQSMIARQSWNIIDKLQARTKNVVVGSEWLNNYFSAGRTAAQVISDTDAYIAGLTGASKPPDAIVWCTPTYSNSLEGSAGNETDRQTIRTHVQGLSIAGIADIGGPLTPMTQTWPAAIPTDLSGDGKHGTDLGTQLWANVLASTLGSVLAGVDSVAAPGPSIAQAVCYPSAAAVGDTVSIFLACMPNSVTGVKVNGVSATGVTWQSAYRIDFTVPAGSGSNLTVEIDWSGGSPLSITNAFSYSAAWTPAALGAKVLFWLRADLGVTGTTWTDQVNGHVFNATAVSTDNSGINGTARILFPNSVTNDLLCAGLTSAATKGQAFAIGKIDSGFSGFTSLWDFGPATATPFPEQLFPFTSGEIYETFGSTIRQGPTVDFELAAGTVFAYEVKADASGNWENFLGGVSVLAQTGNTVGWATGMKLGASHTVAHFDGELEEILVLSDNMTSGEHASWVAYVLARYGIAA